MNKQYVANTVQLSPENNDRLVALCGQYDEHLDLIQSRLNVKLTRRGFSFFIRGTRQSVNDAVKVIKMLYAETQATEELTSRDVLICLQAVTPMSEALREVSSPAVVPVGIANVSVRNATQALYLSNIETHDISFGIGPSGTGKTYLAVAAAVHALLREKVSRIILVRPAVAAGEDLGFLPGDLAQKVDPYLRPLYDALYELLGAEKVTRFIERQLIEIAPLAFMRGRTLSDAFVILDESQNTTEEQMKMFLTRLGWGSKVVVTGDITQIDLPHGRSSGLVHAMTVLKNIQGISFTQFAAKDVVRHHLVQLIVEAYEQHRC